MAIDEKACEGGRVLEDGDFAQCIHCETRIRWDLQNDPFWGWQNCDERTPESAADATARREQQP